MKGVIKKPVAVPQSRTTGPRSPNPNTSRTGRTLSETSRGTPRTSPRVPAPSRDGTKDIVLPYPQGSGKKGDNEVSVKVFARFRPMNERFVSICVHLCSYIYICVCVFVFVRPCVCVWKDMQLDYFGSITHVLRCK